MRDIKTHFFMNQHLILSKFKIQNSKKTKVLEIEGVFDSKLMLLYTPYLNSIKLSVYRIGIKFDKHPLAVEQNNYLRKIVNVYIIYDLDALSRNSTIFKFEFKYIQI